MRGKARQAIALIGLVVLVAGCARPWPASSVKAGQSMEVDLDNDGTPERVTIDQGSGKLGLTIAPQAGKPWHTGLPGRFADLRTEDLNGDRLREVLVESTGPEANTFNLCVIRWAQGRGQVLVPKGGPLAGSVCFRSSYYPPAIEDTTGDASSEIMVSVPSAHAGFLDTLVYEWDGHAFSKSDLYMVPPRIVPAATPAP